MPRFQDVIGHEKIIKYFQTAIRTGQVSHAYILEGDTGSGKKLLARSFAQTLLCESGGRDACGVCHSCRMAESGNHPDILWITHEKPATIAVDEVREQINATIGVKPYSGPYKIYIMDEADKMNQQAQNALLKTIEDPPAYGVFLLLAVQTGSFLPTILSRCVKLSLKPVSRERIKEVVLSRTELSKEEAEFCAGYSMGSLGKAMALAGNGRLVQMREECVHLLSHFHEMEIYEMICSIKEIGKYKEEISEFLDMMMVWYHDVLVLKTTQSADRIVFRQYYSLLRDLSAHMSYGGIQNILYAFDKAKMRLRANVNFDVALELLLLTIKENIVW